MMEERVCPACRMPYDWRGVIAGGQEYCCEPCAAGEACICPQHDHAGALEAGERETAGVGWRESTATPPTEPRTMIP